MIKALQRRDEHFLTINLTDEAPVTPVDGTDHKGKLHKPIFIQLAWTGGEEPNKVTIYGQVFKKDGSFYDVNATSSYALTPVNGYKPVPEWAHQPIRQALNESYPEIELGAFAQPATA
jgi:hypothetical protein